MSGRLILLAAALLAGIMGGIGLWWVLAILLIWLVMKTNRTSFVYVGLFLVIGWGCGRADANQWQNPPQPRGSVTIPASLSSKTGMSALSVGLPTGLPSVVVVRSQRNLRNGWLVMISRYNWPVVMK